MAFGFARGVFFCLAAVVLWGAQLPIAKSAIAQADLTSLNVGRYVIATLVLTPIFLWREGRAALDYEGSFLRLALIGALGMAGPAPLLFWGLVYTRPEHAVVILALQPTLAAFADWRLHGRRPPRGTLACIALAFAGVVMVVTKGNPSIALSQREIFGDLLVLACACCWVGYTLSAARFRHWSSMRFTFLTMLPATAFILVVALAAWLLGQTALPTAAVAWAVAPEVIYLAVVGVVAAMLLWNSGNQRIGGLNAALLLNLMPVVTFTIRFLQGARFTTVEVLGATMVVGALLANNLLARRQHPTAAVPTPAAEP